MGLGDIGFVVDVVVLGVLYWLGIYFLFLVAFESWTYDGYNKTEVT